MGKLHLFIGILILLLGVCHTVSQRDCRTFLVSNVELTDCNDGTCDLINRYSFETTIGDGTKICLSDNSGPSNIDFPDIEIYFNNSNVYYDLYECYQSDDPTILLGAYCGCPGRTHVDCTDCPATPDKTLNNFCISGTHAGSDCLISGSGTTCGYVMFQQSQRYRICKVGKAFTELHVTYKVGNDVKNSTVRFEKETVFELGDALFKIYPLSRSKTLEGHFTVQDTFNDYSFLIVEPSKCNDINEQAPNKLGWYKGNNSVFSPELKRAFDLRINSCRNDSLYLGVSTAKFQTAFLSGKYDAITKSPGAVLMDNQVPVVQESYSHIQETVVELIEGTYFYDTNWIPAPFGLTLGHYLPSSTTFSKRNLTVLTTDGLLTGDFQCTDYTNVYRTDSVYISFMTCLLPGTHSWGMCMKGKNFLTNGTEMQCTNVYSYVNDYPSGILSLWSFRKDSENDDHPGWVQEDFSINQTTVYNPKIVTETLDEYKILFQTTRSNFKFESTSTVPYIETVAVNDDHVEITMYSKRNQGNCIVSFDSDVLATKEVHLATSSATYEFKFLKKKYSGDVTAVVTCYKNSDSVIFHLTISKTEDDVNYDVPLNNTNTPVRVLNPALQPSKYWYIMYGLLPTFWPMLLFGPILGGLLAWNLNAMTPWNGKNLYWSLPGTILSIVLILVILYYCAKLAIKYYFGGPSRIMSAMKKVTMKKTN